MLESIAHDPLQRVKPAEHTLVHGKNDPKPPVQRTRQEAVARPVAKVAARSPPHELPSKCRVCMTDAQKVHVGEERIRDVNEGIGSRGE